MIRRKAGNVQQVNIHAFSRNTSPNILYIRGAKWFLLTQHRGESDNVRIED